MSDTTVGFEVGESSTSDTVVGVILGESLEDGLGLVKVCVAL